MVSRQPMRHRQRRRPLVVTSTIPSAFFATPCAPDLRSAVCSSGCGQTDSQASQTASSATPRPPRRHHRPPPSPLLLAAPLLLLLLLLPCHLQPAAALEDVELQWAQDGWYNPSLVEVDDGLLCAIKGTTYRRTRKKTWWVNDVHLCRGTAALGVQQLQCAEFAPWGNTPYEECEWDFRVRHGKLDVEGLGDIKLWRWPGHGVYAIFGRKPPVLPEASLLVSPALRLVSAGDGTTAAAKVGSSSSRKGSSKVSSNSKANRSLSAAKPASAGDGITAVATIRSSSSSSRGSSAKGHRSLSVAKPMSAAVTAAAPALPSGSRYCPGPLVYQQFLALVQPEGGGTGAGGAPLTYPPFQWLLDVPLALTVDGDLDLGGPLLAGHLPPGEKAAAAEARAAAERAAADGTQVAPGLKIHMEKNWMPFVWAQPAVTPAGKPARGSAASVSAAGGADEEMLLVTYSVQPHRVLQLFPDGRAVPRWVTHNTSLFTKFASVDVHGGPAIMPVPASLAADGKPYFVGVMHHIDRYDGGKSVGLVRVYRHFAFRFSASPPFAIDAISDELPLTFKTTGVKMRRRWIAFVTGLDLNPSGLVRIAYGAADAEARVLTLTLKELGGLFKGGQARFIDYNMTYPAWGTRDPTAPAPQRRLHA